MMKRVFIGLAIFFFLSVRFAAIEASWWKGDRRFRLPIEVAGNGQVFHDRTVVTEVRFDELMEEHDISATVDKSSIRVIEVDAQGEMVSEDVPFQFDNVVEFEAAANASRGELVWFMEGTLEEDRSRHFHVYFDPDAGENADMPEAMVEVHEENISWPPGDEGGQESIHLSNRDGHYYFHRLGGSFASIFDRDTLDWVGWKSSGKWGGNYRGLPNSPGPYHPGYTECTTNILFEGPVRTRIEVNDCTFVWDIYPTYVRATRLKGNQQKWWYEGIPGGEVDSEDSYYLGNGVERYFHDEQYRDITFDEHWAVYKDGAVERSLFLESHPGPYKIKLGGHERTGPETMLVTRFNLPKEPNPMYFTFGFIESRDNDVCTEYVHTVYHDPIITQEAPQMEGAVSAVHGIGRKDLVVGGALRRVLPFVQGTMTEKHGGEYYSIRGRAVGEVIRSGIGRTEMDYPGVLLLRRNRNTHSKGIR